MIEHHVTSLAAKLGLRLSKDQLAELRQEAQAAIANEDLSAISPMDELVKRTGAAMREVVAQNRAQRCCRGGEKLLRKVTAGALPNHEVVPSVVEITVTDGPN